MDKQVIKRWSVLVSVLLVSIWLAWQAPEESYEVVSVSSERAHKMQEQPRSSQRQPIIQDAEIKQYALIARESYDTKTVDLFAINEPKKRKVKPKVIAPPKIKPAVRAPRLPFKYIGKLVEGEVVKVFLLEGQALHIVTKGDDIGQHYRLKEVDDQQLTWLYRPLNLTQKMNIGSKP